MDKNNNELERSQSLCSLDDVGVSTSTEKSHFCAYESSRSQASDSSIEVYVANDSDTDLSVEERSKLEDSGIAEKSAPLDSGAFSILEKKIDQLSNLFLDQCTLLTAIRNDIGDSKDALEKAGPGQHRLLEEMVNKIVAVLQSRALESAIKLPDTNSEEGNSRAKTLLNAIEFKHGFSLERELRDAFIQFLQSDELKERVVSATAESVREVVRGCLSKDVSDVYLPTLERSHRRLASHVSRLLEDAFLQYENSTIHMKHAHRASRALRRALEQHQHLLENCSNTTKFFDGLQNTVEDILKNELKDWRQRVLQLVLMQASTSVPEGARSPSPPAAGDVPASPLQPPNPDLSVIDRLMLLAEINKLIDDGEINASFERALSSSDLSLVMAACRAVHPNDLFTPPCKLEQAVLLSLAQQLATDLVHETQLKCKYLEDAIINLNASNPATRAYLPLVIGDVRKHLINFLEAYPGHVASRRISLIVMAAGSLLK